MNVVQLAGGVGNQIFQYAFAKAQMAKGVEVSCIPPWIGWKWPHPRKYVIDKFHTDIPVHSLIKGNKRVVERSFQLRHDVLYDLKWLTMEGCNFEGYWQYMPYYKSLLPLLEKELWVKEEFHTKQYETMRRRITDSNSVSVHVRRTDYVGAKAYSSFPFSYYLKALQLVEGDLFIFSDDIPWCKEVFKKDYFDRKITFVHMIEYLDFELMRLCKHNVSANSTFSYWASLLNPNPDKKVIVSGKWLADTEEDDKELHFPKKWIRL